MERQVGLTRGARLRKQWTLFYRVRLPPTTDVGGALDASSCNRWIFIFANTVEIIYVLVLDFCSAFENDPQTI